MRQAIWEPSDEATLGYIVRAATCHGLGPGRRRYERVPTRLPVTLLHRGRRHEGGVATLSCGGALVETDANLGEGEGERLALRLLLPDGPLSLHATVRHQTSRGPGLHGFGVEFDPRGAQESDRLACYVRVRKALFEV